VLIQTQAAIRNLDAARLAADVSGVPTILVARTDAEIVRCASLRMSTRSQAKRASSKKPWPSL
jgi:isocitrate lyase